MKNLVEFIKENQDLINEYYRTMNDINFDIICESFKANILSEVVAQSKLAMEEYHDRQAANRYASISKPTDLKYVFTSFAYKWDAITNDRVKRFVGNDKEGKKMFMRICTHRGNSTAGIIIFENPAIVDDSKQHKYSGMLIKNVWGTLDYYGIMSSQFNRDRVKPSQALSYINDDTIYNIIEFNENDEISTIRNERSRRKSGIVPIPSDNKNVDFRQMYKEMAEKNMTRYKRLAAKLRVDKLAANDDIPDRVMTAVSTVMDLAKEFSKNPIKYAKYEYDIRKLLDLVSDKSYSAQGYNKKWQTYGINGLMYLFSSYISCKLELAKGNSYESDRTNFERYKKSINEMLERINNSYLKLKDVLAKEETTTE